MRKYIASEIERRRAELAALEERRLVLASQLSVLEDLLVRAPSTDEQRRTRSARSSSSHGANQRRLSERWMPVLLEAVRRHPRTVRGDEVPDIQRAAGQAPAEASNIRSHFWANAKPGKFYERVAMNEYRATEAGAKLVGMSLGAARHNNGAEHDGPAPSEFESSDEPRPDKARFDLLNHNAA